MALSISSAVRNKLHEKHRVSEEEIIQCFSSREKGFLEDTREEHKTRPPTLWFVAETDYGRTLKIMFIYEDKIDEDGVKSKVVSIKSAYEPSADVVRIYNKFADID